MSAILGKVLPCTQLNTGLKTALFTPLSRRSANLLLDDVHLLSSI